MRIIITLFIILSGFFLNAQSNELLTGKWEFTGIYQREKLDEKSAQMVEMMFNDMFFDFKKGGTYILVGLGKVEEGVWKLDANKKEIELIPTKGSKSRIEIIELQDDQLTVRFAKAAFVMMRDLSVE